jgi:hypothetical protein
MKKLISFFLLAFTLTACAQGTPAVPTSIEPTPAPKSTLVLPTSTAYPEPTKDVSEYPPPQTPEGYPLLDGQTENPYPEPQIAVMVPETRFGIPAVDRVLDSLFQTTGEINSLIVYTVAHCSTAEGLGGPPKCAQDQSEGTQVEGLPVYGPEGHFLPKSEQTLTDLPGKVDLLGVFKVVEDYKSEDFYPAGQYGIVLKHNETGEIIVLRVTETGIVRLDNPVQIPGKEQVDLEAYLEAKP